MLDCETDEVKWERGCWRQNNIDRQHGVGACPPRRAPEHLVRLLRCEDDGSRGWEAVRGCAMPLDSPRGWGDAAIQTASQLNSYPDGIPDSVVDGTCCICSLGSILILSPPLQQLRGQEPFTPSGQNMSQSSSKVQASNIH